MPQTNNKPLIPHAACHRTRLQNRGFTLLELAVVLVVIGLVTGSIFVGRDLIRASGINSTVAQLNKFNSAAYAFQSKYGYLPGDIPGTKAYTFNLYYITGSLAGAIGCGDANDIIEGWNTTPWVGGANFAGEVVMFFLHLSQAGLIDGMYGAGGAHVTISGATTTGGSYSGGQPPTVTSNSTYVNEILPAAKLGNGNFFTVGSSATINYYILTGVNQVKASADLVSTNNITPVEAVMMDKKIDDGLPGSGTVFALDTVTTPISSGNGTEVTNMSANNCIDATGKYYNTGSSTYANTMNCSLRFQFQ